MISQERIAALMLVFSFALSSHADLPAPPPETPESACVGYVEGDRCWVTARHKYKGVCQLVDTELVCVRNAPSEKPQELAKESHSETATLPIANGPLQKQQGDTHDDIKAEGCSSVLATPTSIFSVASFLAGLAMFARMRRRK